MLFDPLIGPVSDALIDPFGDLFNSRDLFRNGEAGAAIIPGVANCFQDAAGTTPAGVGDPVALVLDQSGNGLNAIQDVNDDYRPTLQQAANGRCYLDFDGIDDYLYIPSLDMSGTDKVMVVVGVHKESDAALGLVVEHGAPADDGTFLIGAPINSGVDNLGFASKGTINRTVKATGVTAPITNVVTGVADISSPSVVIRVDGVEEAQNTDSQGAVNYGDLTTYIGSRGGASLFFSGHIYGLIVRGAYPTDAELAKTERLMARQTGVSL